MLDEINIKFPNFFSCDEFCSPSGALICAQLKPRICYRGIFSIAGGIFPIRSLKSFQARITLRKVGVEKSGEKADNVECELETFGFYFWTLLILSATWAGVNDPFATLVLQRVKVPRSWVRTGDAKTNGCWVDEYFRWSL